MTETYDIVIIGAGSGGLVVASGASQLGAKVALVEKHKMGGECLNTGCVPSKTLIHSAKVVSLMKRAETFGLDPVNVKFDYSKVIDHVHSVINRISRHDSVERFEGLGCDVFLDGARFESPNEIKVGDKKIRGKKFVIATGSSPLMPPFPGLREMECLTNENVFEKRDASPITHCSWRWPYLIGISADLSSIRFKSYHYYSVPLAFFPKRISISE